MKVNNRKNESGSALVVTIVITGVLTLAMAGYLALVSGQYRLTMRSQNWNATIPVTEAGVEEALAHLNENCVTNGINVNKFKPENDGWASIGSNKYSKERTLSDGSSYVTTVDLTLPNKPTILSEGYLPAGVVSLKPSAFFATVSASDANTTTAKAPFNRNVAVTTRIVPVFSHALAADKDISMNGNNVSTDSFNSKYGPWNPSSRLDNGDVATNSKLSDDLKVGNANIRGKLSIGPGGTKPDIGNNGVVGSGPYVDGGGSGIEEGRWNADMNVDFEDVEAPFTTGMYPDIPYLGTSLSNIFSTNVIATCSCSGGNNCCIPGDPSLGGVVSAITVQTNTVGYPSSGSYVGVVTTNWISQSGASYPSGTVRNVLPVSVAVTSEPYEMPADGTYVGNVTPSIVEIKKANSIPAKYEAGSLRKPDYTYDVKVYHYQKITGYTWEKLSSYTYAAITGYQRAIVTTTSVTNSATLFDVGFPTSGNYKVGSLSGSIYVGGDVVVYCTGSFTASSLYIAPGARLRLYVGGDIDFTGNNKVNEGGLAKNLSVYGLPTCKNIKLAGNAEFTGTIYAPQAHLQMNGGGSDTKDFFGAIIVGSAQLNGHVNFHFDEDLMDVGPARGFIANSWREE